jgi:hypothetical protein
MVIRPLPWAGWIFWARNLLGGQITGLAKKKVLESFASEDPKAKSLQNSKLGGALGG